MYLVGILLLPGACNYAQPVSMTKTKPSQTHIPHGASSTSTALLQCWMPENGVPKNLRPG